MRSGNTVILFFLLMCLIMPVSAVNFPVILTKGTSDNSTDAIAFTTGNDSLRDEDHDAPATCTTCESAGGCIPASQRMEAQQEQVKIQAIQERIRRDNLSWTAGKTSVSDLTPSAYRALLRLKHPGPGTTDIPVRSLDASDIEASSSLPEEFDWRDNNGDWTTPIRNQGGCGSCWAFGSTATFESYWERVQNDPDLNPDFAEQYLVSCDTANDGCDGGFSTALASFVTRPGASGGIGIVNESDYPYSATTTTCKSLAGIARYTVPSGGSWSYLAGDCVISSVEATKRTIYKYGPVNAYFYATDAFSTYTGGIFEDPGHDYGACQTNHVIDLVGWGHDPVKNKDYWIAKNSWGTSWGESGWFRIYVDQCRIGEGVAYLKSPVPKITAVTPATGTRNTSVNYTITGQYFQSGATNVTFRNSTGAYLDGGEADITLVTSTSISGTLQIPANATAGPWNVSVSTPLGGITWKSSAFTVKPVLTPSVTAITPLGPWYRNATINYTITGQHFQPGKTEVRFQSRNGPDLNATSGSGVTSVTPTQITGMVVIPYDAPATSYNITVTTPDGGKGIKESAFSIAQLQPPTVTILTPSSSYRNTTVLFTITGKGFQSDSSLMDVAFMNGFTGGSLDTTIISATSTTMTGMLAIPAGTTAGSYHLIVRSADGGTTVRETAFTINPLPVPVIKAMNQTSGRRNSTVSFAITGNYFQGDGGTSVRLNSTAGAPLNAVLTSVTPGKITGTIAIPTDAGTGKYRLDILTVDGGAVCRQNTFTVSA